MKYTNKYNLPQPVADAISRDTYIRGDNNYSVTELIEPPQIVQLKRRHWDDITEDVIDNVWSIFGSAVHHIMETHTSDESFVEQRYYIRRMGRTVGGMVDCYNDGIISDYKVTSAWSIVYGSKQDHWAQQLNLYAHIMRSNGIEVNKLQIIAFLRDWDRNKAKQDYTYPQVPLLIIPIPLWDSDTAETYLLNRLELHIENEDKQSDILTPCTSEERWCRPSTWALMKEGRKSAYRVFDDDGDLFNYMEDADLLDEYEPHKTRPKKGFSVVERKGACMRCESYCSVKPFCRQVI